MAEKKKKTSYVSPRQAFETNHDFATDAVPLLLSCESNQNVRLPQACRKQASKLRQHSPLHHLNPAAVSYLEVKHFLALADRAIHGRPLPLAERTLQHTPPPAGLVELSNLAEPLERLLVHLARPQTALRVDPVPVV